MLRSREETLLYHHLYRFSLPGNAFTLCKFKRIMIELPEHQFSVIHITLNSDSSVIDRLKRLSKFFCKLLIFRRSIEKLPLSKWFKFREDSSRVKYCESLKLKALKKFSFGSWLSLIAILSKSKVLKAIDSKSAFPSHNARMNKKNTSKRSKT